MGKKQKKKSQPVKIRKYASSLGILCVILAGILVYSMNQNEKELNVLEKKLNTAKKTNEHYSEMDQVLEITKKVIDPMMNIAQDRGIDDLPKYKEYFTNEIYRTIRQGNKAILSNGVEIYTDDTTFSNFESKKVKIYPGFILTSDGEIKNITTATRFTAVYDKGKEVEMLMELEFLKEKEGWRIKNIPKFSTVENLPTTISEKKK